MCITQRILVIFWGHVCVTLIILYCLRRWIDFLRVHFSLVQCGDFSCEKRKHSNYFFIIKFAENHFLLTTVEPRTAFLHTGKWKSAECEDSNVTQYPEVFNIAIWSCFYESIEMIIDISFTSYIRQIKLYICLRCLQIINNLFLSIRL